MIVRDWAKLFRVAWWVLATARLASAGIACLSNPCSHGICIDDINSTFSCYCVDGYTGIQCQTNWDECWSAPCQNGGTCIDGIASYNCSCPDGFIGDNCETNFNECESNPCSNNGTCIDITNGYVCSCAPGFAGAHCELDVAVCNSTEEVRCHNGGQCIEGPGFKFYCKCLPGWAGPKCEDQIDECESNPCQNGGVCIDVHADYMCACAFGYTGKSCEVKIEFCDQNSCSKNAICVVEDGLRVCYCVPDYHGERCEFQYDECLLGPRCMNGGTCIDGVDNFTCSCPPMLTGSLCECLILDDGTYDCNYIKPTFSTVSTQSVSLHTNMFDTTTDESDFTTLPYNTGYNDTTTTTTTIIPPITMETPNTTLVVTALVTFGESSVETTTELMTSTNISRTESPNTSMSVTFESTESTEISTDMVSTYESSTKETLESDNTKVEVTTTCLGICERPSETTTLIISSDNKTVIETTSENVGIITIGPPTDVSVKSTDTSLATVEVTTTIITETTVNEIFQTTPSIDSTTEKMFTDTPTIHSVTDLPTLPTYSTTEVMEVSTGLDNTTYISTTVQSECTRTVCNQHGTCINTPHGIRCLCTFNYRGRFCDEKINITSAAFNGNSFIAHKLQNTTSIDVVFEAKTLITDGQIMYVDIDTGVYMQLYMNSGLLKFKFSCGYQTMLLSELKTYVNKGYPMKIETRLDLYLKEQHCNATLRLNDTVAMSGGQVANISSLDHNSTLYLGYTPHVNDTETKPFVGCIWDLTVNEDKHKVFEDAVDAGDINECSSLSCLSGPCLNGGSCSDHGEGYSCSCGNGWMGEHCEQSVCEHNPCKSGGSCVLHPGSGFLCLCPYGKHGIFCEYNIEVTRPSMAPISIGISSFLIYPLSPMAMNSDRFDLRLRFQTTDMDQIALLAFIGQNGRHDSHSQHLALTFVKGYIMLTWNLGNGPRRIFTARALGSRSGGHVVRVWRRGRAAGLNVDGRHNVTGNAPAHDTKMTLLPYLYIGGHPSQEFRDLPHDLPLHNGWRGCIWEVGGQAIGSGKAVGGRGVGQCGVTQCTAKSCNAPRGVCIHSPATYGCICNEGWFGVTCSVTRNPCDSAHNPCRGRCVITAGDRARCDCPYGKTGIHCDQDSEPTDVLFTGVRSYARLYPRTVASVSLSFEAEIKPTRERGLVIFAETPHFYTTLSLQGGLLEYRWTDRLSGVTSLVRSGVVLSMSQWHSVKAGRYGSRLYVWVDGSLSTEAMLAHAYPHTASNASIILGGAEDLSTLPFDAMSGPSESYTGCIRNFHINNILLTLERHNIQDGQNLEDCDGTPCGSETCGGNGCVVEGRSRRCRRGAGCAGCAGCVGCAGCEGCGNCSRATCAPPRGHCRANSCVCSAGHAGRNCETKINVTVPQFTGASLVAVRRAPRQRLAEPRAAPGPVYLALNFTTAEPSGLLLWTHMVDDYIGIGIENGYLKLVWQFHNNSRGNKTPSSLRKSLPHAGFVADGEWHHLVMRLNERGVTLTVDDQPAYVEEPGAGPASGYDPDVFIGGITDNSIAKRTFPHNFKGCIDNISTREGTYMTSYGDIYSENVMSCQLFP